MPPKCQNHELVAFLEERKRSARNPAAQRGGSGDRWTHIYGKAIASIRKYPLPILSGSEAQTLDGIGPFIAKLVDDFIAGKDVALHGGKRRKTGDESEGVGPNPKKTRKPSSITGTISSSSNAFPVGTYERSSYEELIGGSQDSTRETRRLKLYTPRRGTVAWSIVIAMFRRIQRHPEENVFSRRIIAQLSAEILIGVDKPASATYTGAIGTLMKHGLIEVLEDEKGSYRLTQDGKSVAQELENGMCKRDESGKQSCVDEDEQSYSQPIGVFHPDSHSHSHSHSHSQDVSKAIGDENQKGQQMAYLSEDGVCVAQKDRSMVTFKEDSLFFRVVCNSSVVNDSTWGCRLVDVEDCSNHSCQLRGLYFAGWIHDLWAPDEWDDSQFPIQPQEGDFHGICLKSRKDMYENVTRDGDRRPKKHVPPKRRTIFLYHEEESDEPNGGKEDEEEKSLDAEVDDERSDDYDDEGDDEANGGDEMQPFERFLSENAEDQLDLRPFHKRITLYRQSTLSQQMQDIPDERYELMLLVDNREKRRQTERGFFVKQLGEEAGLPVEQRPLVLGDMCWILRFPSGEERMSGFILERKTVDDLAQSMEDGRYYEQKVRLQLCGLPFRFYVVEGDVDVIAPTERVRKALRTALLTCQVRDGFFVRNTMFIRETLTFLSDMHSSICEFLRRTRIDDPSYISRMPTFEEFGMRMHKSRNMTTKDLFQKQLTAFRGCSATRARAIVESFGTPRWLLDEMRRHPTRLDRIDFLGKMSWDRVSVGKTLADNITSFFEDEKYSHS